MFRIKREIYNYLKKLYKIMLFGTLIGIKQKTRVFMLCKDSSGVVVTAYPVKTNPDRGCLNMPALDNSSLHELYIRASKESLTPIGYARVNGKIDTLNVYWGKNWHDEQVLLTLANGTIIAETLTDKSMRIFIE